MHVKATNCDDFFLLNLPEIVFRVVDREPLFVKQNNLINVLLLYLSKYDPILTKGA
jgi:hypothetical protein